MFPEEQLKDLGAGSGSAWENGSGTRKQHPVSCVAGGNPWINRGLSTKESTVCLRAVQRQKGGKSLVAGSKHVPSEAHITGWRDLSRDATGESDSWMSGQSHPDVRD